MAHIFNPTMTLSTTSAEVAIKINYGLRFNEHELHEHPTGPALYFSEEIEILGATLPLAFSSMPLQPQSGTIVRQRSWTVPRNLFDRGALPAPVRCRIRIVVSPPTGATADTNTEFVPSLAVRSYTPLKRLGWALAPAIGAVILVVGATALIRGERASDLSSRDGL